MTSTREASEEKEEKNDLAFANAVIDYLKALNANEATIKTTKTIDGKKTTTETPVNVLEYFANDEMDELGAGKRLFFDLTLSRAKNESMPELEIAAQQACANNVKLLQDFRRMLDEKVTVSYDLKNGQNVKDLVMTIFEEHIEAAPAWKPFWEAICKQFPDVELQEMLKYKIAGAVAYRVLVTANELNKINIDTYAFVTKPINDPGDIEAAFQTRINKITSNVTNFFDSKAIEECISNKDTKRLNEKLSMLEPQLNAGARTNKEFASLGDSGNEALNKHLLKFIESIEALNVKDTKLKNHALNQIAEIIRNHLNLQYGDSKKEGVLQHLDEAVNRIIANNEPKQRPAYHRSTSRLLIDTLRSRNPEVKEKEKVQVNTNNETAVKKQENPNINVTAEKQPKQVQIQVDEHRHDDKPDRQKISRTESSKNLNRKDLDKVQLNKGAINRSGVISHPNPMPKSTSSFTQENQNIRNENNTNKSSMTIGTRGTRK